MSGWYGKYSVSADCLSALALEGPPFKCPFPAAVENVPLGIPVARVCSPVIKL